MSIPIQEQSETFTPATFISVIIPARNEADNISACLDSINNQSYPKHLFEVWVVDDHSTDETAAIVKSFSSSNIRLISLKDHLQNGPINSYKKKAIEIAIARAKGNLIVTTDADCVAPHDWLRMIADNFEKSGTRLLVMPVAVNCGLHALEIFESLDFMTLQGITGAAVQMRNHSMCNGANLAYTKMAFDSVSGFAGIDQIASGDDMLLMHKIRKKYPEKISFLKSRDVIIQTRPSRSIGDFLRQRARWASKTGLYEDKSITIVLAIVYAFNLMLLFSAIFMIFKNQPIIFFRNGPRFSTAILLFLALKIIVELSFLYPVALFFNKQKLLWLFPLAQPFHIIYIVMAGFLGKSGSYQWKGRTVK